MDWNCSDGLGDGLKTLTYGKRPSHNRERNEMRLVIEIEEQSAPLGGPIEFSISIDEYHPLSLSKYKGSDFYLQLKTELEAVLTSGTERQKCNFSFSQYRDYPDRQGG